MLRGKTLLDFKKWVKSIQTTGYNGPHNKVCTLINIVAKVQLKILNVEKFILFLFTKREMLYIQC